MELLLALVPPNIMQSCIHASSRKKSFLPPLDTAPLALHRSPPPGRRPMPPPCPAGLYTHALHCTAFLCMHICLAW